MSVSSQFAAALALLGSGWLLSRWAAKHDIKSWVMDALWRMVLRRDWKGLRQSDMKEILDRDGVLRDQFSGKISDIKRDQERYGAKGALAKHGALLAMAYAASWVSGMAMLVGAVMLAHGIYRGWS